MIRSFKILYTIGLAGIMVGHIDVAQANDCPFIPPDTSPGWKNFHNAVQNEYGAIPSSDRGQSLIYGHAMGRMEKALNGDPIRAVDLACVKRKLEQDFFNNAIKGRLDGFDWFLAQEAAKGRHNQEVTRISGIHSQAPLYKSFDTNGSGSFAAGPVAGGRVGGGGIRIAIREGSRPRHENGPAWQGGTTLPPPPANEGPNYDDIIYTPNGGGELENPQPQTRRRSPARSIDPSRRGNHPCGRHAPEDYGDAYWHINYSERPESVTYWAEYEGYVCSLQRLRYRTYEGPQMKEFECDYGWRNCRPTNTTGMKYTKIQEQRPAQGYDADSIFRYTLKKGLAIRMPHYGRTGTVRKSSVKKFWMIGR